MFLQIYVCIGLLFFTIEVMHNMEPLKWVASIFGDRIIWLAVFGYMFLWPVIVSIQVFKILNDINK